MHMLLAPVPCDLVPFSKHVPTTLLPLPLAVLQAHASIQTAMRKAAAARAPPTHITDAADEPADAAKGAAKRAPKLKGIPPERVLPSRHARAVAQEGIKATSVTGAAAAAAAARQKELQEEAEQEDANMEEASEGGQAAAEVLMGF